MGEGRREGERGGLVGGGGEGRERDKHIHTYTHIHIYTHAPGVSNGGRKQFLRALPALPRHRFRHSTEVRVLEAVLCVFKNTVPSFWAYLEWK